MTVTHADETPRRSAGAHFSDAVTFAFGDLDAQLYGIARLGLSPGPDGTVQASGLAVLFSGLEPVAVRTAGGLPVATATSWGALHAAGVQTVTHVPLESWDVSFAGDDGASGFRLHFEALAPAAQREPGTEAMAGYEQLCRVTGVATVRGEERAVSCLGQRGHAWGTLDWERTKLARTVSAWLEEDLALALTAIRPAKATSHADEALAAWLWAPFDGDGTVAAVVVPEARLSTTVDADGRQRRASIEVFLDEEDPGSRAAGEVLCGTSLDLGRLRLDCSFFVWRMNGRTGVGRYDVLRHAG